MKKIIAESVSGIYALINVFGMLVALPLFFGVAMSFDHANEPPHWAHLAFVFGTLAYPTLSIAGIISKNQRYMGLFGLLLAIVGWSLLSVVCNGQFNCKA